jgi:endoglucanase
MRLAALLLAFLQTCSCYPAPSQPIKFDIPHFRGMNLPSMEWKDLGEPQLEEAQKVAYDKWHANTIRLPLSQDRWFGKASDQSDDGTLYRAKVDRMANVALGRHKYLILDLHWSDAAEWGKNIGQHKMPDANSLAFWKDVAPRYKNNPYVGYDLYNEPHDVTWDIWRDGGEVSETVEGKGLKYRAVGMRTLLQTVRDSGAKNWVIISGLEWSRDFRGIASGYALTDDRIIYGIHIYPWQNWDNFKGIVGRYPATFMEFGAQPQFAVDPPKWLKEFWEYADANGLGWVCWSFHPACHPLIKDWSFEPTDFSGIYMKAKLEKAQEN